MHYTKYVVSSALVLCMGMSVQAAQVFSNYQGGNPGGSAFGFDQALAVQFTPLANAYVTDVQMYVMSGGEGVPSTLNAFLMSDNGGLPGVVLESLGSLPTQTSFTPNLVQRLASGTTLLQAGTPYWLAATLDAGSQAAGGWQNGGSPSVLTAFANTGGLSGPWGVPSQNGFQFIITSAEVRTEVPEPGTAALAGAAIAVFGIALRRRTR